jgi:hypothetical protein
MKHLVLALLAVVVLTSSAFAQGTTEGPDRKITKVATTGAQFLKLGYGARATSLGGSYVADANDLSALYWNPAGLAQITGSAVQLSRTEYLADIKYSNVAFGTNVGDMGVIAASIIYLDSGEMEVRTENEPEGTGERFKVQDFALQLSYSRFLTDRFSLGTTVKYVQEQIWHSSASAVAFDIGVLFSTPFKGVRLGASIANFGSKMTMSGRDIIFSADPDPVQDGTADIINSQFLTDGQSMPLMFRIGLSWDAISTSNHRIRLLTDAAHPNDNSEYVNLGAEYSFRDLIAFRGGYKNLFEEDGEQGLTFGAGINVRLDKALRARFDYAYADFGRLESTHWFTVDLQF